MIGNGTQAIKSMFDKILNTPLIVKESLDDVVKEEFLTLIHSLKEAYSLEKDTNKTVDISKVTKVFWGIIESNLEIIYGEEATSLIFDYVESKRPKFKTEDSLWNAVKELIEYPEMDF